MPSFPSWKYNTPFPGEYTRLPGWTWDPRENVKDTWENTPDWREEYACGETSYKTPNTEHNETHVENTGDILNSIYLIKIRSRIIPLEFRFASKSGLELYLIERQKLKIKDIKTDR